MLIGLAFAWMAFPPAPAWGQWSGTNPLWTNSTVGIGTSSPSTMLHVVGNLAAWQASNGFVQLRADNAVVWRSGNGNASLRFGSATNLTAGSWSEKMRITDSGNVGIGTGNPQYKLAVNGNIGAKEVIVTNSLADYVFRPGYRLRPLSEVSAYIQAHRHLPDIPSQAEAEQQGIGVGDMQARLLAKVEELTLHLIRQDRENRELRRRVAQLETRVAAAPPAGR
ncbi:MAG: hypothetical protein KIT09_17040 [Bryobacteraceae bacterium]|nr:hypothetical protein [Bryobacteraceae bacterium]